MSDNNDSKDVTSRSKPSQNQARDRSPYLEILSTGEKVGKLPGFLEVKLLQALGHPESPIRAIRSKCLDCSVGSAGEVRKCVAIDCPLWPMRMGQNPFHGKGNA